MPGKPTTSQLIVDALAKAPKGMTCGEVCRALEQSHNVLHSTTRNTLRRLIDRGTVKGPTRLYRLRKGRA